MKPLAQMTTRPYLHTDHEAPHGDNNKVPHTRTPLVDKGTIAIALYEYVFSVDPQGAYV